MAGGVGKSLRVLKHCRPRYQFGVGAFVLIKTQPLRFLHKISPAAGSILFH